MKLSQETMAILKNFSTINSGMLFRKGNMISTCSINKSIIANVKVKEEFPVEFAIYDLPQLLGVLSMMGDPDISFTESSLVIKNDNQTVEYSYTDSLNIVFLPEDFELETTSLDVTITQDEISALIKASNILKLTDFTIYNETGEGLVMLVETEDGSDNVFSIKHDSDEGTPEFDMSIPVKSLNFVPSDYSLGVSDNGAAIEFTSGDLSYVIGVKNG